MKNSLLCPFFLMLSSTITCTTTAELEFIQSSNSDLTTQNNAFDANSFLKLIEEYTHLTKIEPKNVSEELAITSLIGRLTEENLRIETEIKHSKILNNGILPKKTEDRLRQCSDSTKTALRELYKRQGLVRSLAKNTAESTEPIQNPTGSMFFGPGRLSASYQFVRNIFPSRTHIKECLLQAPMLTSC